METTVSDTNVQIYVDGKEHFYDNTYNAIFSGSNERTSGDSWDEQLINWFWEVPHLIPLQYFIFLHDLKQFLMSKNYIYWNGIISLFSGWPREFC